MKNARSDHTDVMQPAHMRGTTALLAVLATALLTACQQPTISDKTTADGLAEVEHARMDLVQVDPAANFAQYRSLQIGDLKFTNTHLVDPNTLSNPRYRNLTLDDADKQRLNQLFQQQMTKQLQKSGVYTLASAAAAGTVRVETEMVRLKPNAPREKDEIFTSSARNKTFSRGAGAMTLESTLYDSVSGKRLAVLRDEIEDNDMWGQNNVVTNTAAIQRAFSRWASQLQNALEKFQTVPRP